MSNRKDLAGRIMAHAFNSEIEKSVGMRPREKAEAMERLFIAAMRPPNSKAGTVKRVGMKRLKPDLTSQRGLSMRGNLPKK